MLFVISKIRDEFAFDFMKNIRVKICTYLSFEIYINFRGNVRNHIKKCWQAVQNDQELPDEPVEVVKFNKSVAFMEAITESISQLCISCIILRIYGVSTFTFTKFFQFFSLITSLLSLCVAFGTVSFLYQSTKVKK